MLFRSLRARFDAVPSDGRYNQRRLVVTDSLTPNRCRSSHIDPTIAGSMDQKGARVDRAQLLTMNDQPPKKTLPTQTISMVVQNDHKLGSICGFNAATGQMERTRPLSLH